MSILDVSSNEICGVGESRCGTHDLSGLAALMKSISNLKELNISSNGLQAKGAAILVPVLEDKGAMSILNVSKNNIGVEGAKALAPAM